MKQMQVFFAFLVLVSAAAAQSNGGASASPTYKPEIVQFRSFSGEDLIEFCRDASESNRDMGSNMCVMYISGFLDGYSTGLLLLNHEKQYKFCTPDGVTPTQVAKIVARYGSLHPEGLHINAALFSAAALKDAFPCQE